MKPLLNSLVVAVLATGSAVVLSMGSAQPPVPRVGAATAESLHPVSAVAPRHPACAQMPLRPLS